MRLADESVGCTISRPAGPVAHAGSLCSSMSPPVWRDPFEVAVALRAQPGLVLLESMPGFGDSGRRSMLAAAPAEIATGRIDDLGRLERGCWAGWLSYDLGREIERLPVSARTDRRLPALALARFDAWIEFDHERREVSLRGDGPVRALLAGVLQEPLRHDFRQAPPAQWASSLPRVEYEHAVREAIDLIRAGDIFQVNLSQRLTRDWDGDALALYKRTRELAPAPFMALVRLAGADVISASPELFLRRRGRRIETRPIKGTRPRGRDATEDAALVRQLAASEKDRAENVMIVDLARNDLGRVCEYGSVRVDRICALESHAAVHHLVSAVSGRLQAGSTIEQIVRASFPPGSVTGAPKIRAMEVIDQLEPISRGPYCGSLVWIEPNGDFDMSVAIRTMIATAGKLDLHVGGAVVADSDPHAEWRESMHKGARLLDAAGGRAPELAERELARS